MKRVSILSTSVANLASVQACLARLKVSVTTTRCPVEVEQASHLIIPGVGALGPCVDLLDQLELREPIRARLADNRPTLGICLGMQLMGLGSEESPGARGLGFIERTALRFGPELVVPQMGWNRVSFPSGGRVIQPGYAYFANSYRWNPQEASERWALAEYGEPFVAGFERGNIIGCQFHPELSGAWGTALVERFLSLEVTC